MSGVLSRLVRRIPPFKNMYYQMDDLKKKNEQAEKKYEELNKRYAELEKKYEYIFSVEQRYEKNMNAHYELLKQEARDTKQEMRDIKQEVRNNKKTMDERHEQVVTRIDGNHKAIVEKEKKDTERLQTVDRQLMKDIQYYYYKGLHPDQYEENLREWYYKRTGELLNLDNPQTYNEKIQWMKLYDSTQVKADLADKYLVREYVKEKIGEEYLIPLLGVWEKAEDIPFEEMPEQYVLKTNHGCGYNIIVRDKKELNVEDAKNKLTKWMDTNFAYSAGLELHYKLIKPLIIAEKYIENMNGEVNDYKVFCFNGKAKYIMFLTDRQTNLKMAFYDTDWNLMPFVYSYDRLTDHVPRPDNLEELIRISEKLAQGFPHVRVDFYRLNTGKYKFGEMTFTSYSGACLWNPPEYNQILGDLIDLPKNEHE